LVRRHPDHLTMRYSVSQLHFTVGLAISQSGKNLITNELIHLNLTPFRQLFRKLYYCYIFIHIHKDNQIETEDKKGKKRKKKENMNLWHETCLG